MSSFDTLGPTAADRTDPARPWIARVPREPHGGPWGASSVPGGPPPALRVDASANVNAFGPFPGVVEVVARTPIAGYPDPEARAARAAAARLWGLTLDEVRFTPGASEVIHRLARTFLRPGDRAVVLGPTFGEYRRAVRLAGAEPLEMAIEPIPEDRAPTPNPAELSAAVARARPSLVFLCAPNNPTGSALLPVPAQAIVEALPTGALLVLDESFRSFAAGTFAPPALSGDERVVHIRSATKCLALAGLRAGFVSGPPHLLDLLDRAEPPWNTSAPAQAATEAALSPEGIAHLERSLALLRAERERLASALADLGWEVRSSVTNFLLCRVEQGTRWTSALARRGVLVRDCTSFGLPGHVRVAVRTPAENRVVLEAIEASREELR